MGDFSLEVDQLRKEAEDSLPRCAEVKYEWRRNFAPPIRIQGVHRANFVFLLLFLLSTSHIICITVVNISLGSFIGHGENDIIAHFKKID
jgi:hypothetical protein